MPTYEYECNNCGHQFDLFQSITAKALKRMGTPCEGCGKKCAITRLISGGAAVLFKGTGFYETDYRSEGYKKAAKADAEVASGKKSGDKSGDSKAKDTKSTEGGSDGKSSDSKSSKPSKTAD